MFSLSKVPEAGGMKKKTPTFTAYFDVVFKENSVIVCESSVFKMYSVHTKTKSRHFQIPPTSGF